MLIASEKEKGSSNSLSTVSSLSLTPAPGAVTATPNKISSDLHLRIKSNIRNVEVTVVGSPAPTVATLKGLVQQALLTSPDHDSNGDHYIRLICKGKLLAPDTSPLSDFGIQTDDAVHAVIAQAGARHKSVRRRRRGGTVVGPGGRVTRASDAVETSDDESDDDSADGDVEEGQRERRGFDRLRSAGLRRQEITAIRTYFNRQVDRHVQTHANEHADESDLRQRRLLFEEDWMALQGPTSEFRMNLNQNTLIRFAQMGGGDMANWRSTLGTDRDFLWGFMLGFFVGFVMLVWVWMPTVPHKQKIGILTGISFQLAMNVLRQEEPDEFDGE